MLALPSVPALDGRGLADGTEVIVGIRPESVAPFGMVAADRSAPVTGEVELVEPLGAQVHVQLQLGDHRLGAMLPPSDLPRPGDRMTLAGDVDRIHVFDDAGRRIDR